MKEPIRTAKMRNAPVLIRSITAPETIEAVVHEKSRNAAQNTPRMRSCMCAPMNSSHGSANDASENPPEANGTLGNAK